MGNKFQRNYRLQVTYNSTHAIGPLPRPQNQILTVTPPFTLEFDISRTALWAANTCSLRVYNLSKFNTAQILHDFYDRNNYQPITLDAGYGSQLSNIFIGSVNTCYSKREGTNFVTTIECRDAGLAYSEVITSFSADGYMTYAQILTRLIGQLAPFGISMGLISSDYNQVVPVGTQYNGPIVNILHEITNGRFFFDSQRFYAMSEQNINGQFEYIPSPNFVVNSDSGLLGTPERQANCLYFDILFEPSLYVGQLISIQSKDNQNYNAQKVQIRSLHHKGTISNAICGEAITTIGVLVASLNIVSLNVPAAQT